MGDAIVPPPPPNKGTLVEVVGIAEAIASLARTAMAVDSIVVARTPARRGSSGGESSDPQPCLVF